MQKEHLGKVRRSQGLGQQGMPTTLHVLPGN